MLGIPLEQYWNTLKTDSSLPLLARIKILAKMTDNINRITTM